MLEVSAMQLRAGGMWDPRLLPKAAKSNALRRVIEKEIREGEAKIRDALLGDSLWDDKALKALEQKTGKKSG
jgi:hypothetical protein